MIKLIEREENRLRRRRKREEENVVEAEYKRACCSLKMTLNMKNAQ